jgi:hypothetical protein
MTPPGTRLRALARRLLASTTMERLIDPVIADPQHEHNEAVRGGFVWCGLVVRMVGYAAVWKVIAIAAARQAISERTVEEDRAVGRAVAYSLLAVIAVTASLLWPHVNTIQRSATCFSYYAALFLVRQAEEYRGWLPPEPAAWMPNLAVLVIALLLFRMPHPAKEEFQ